MSLGRVRGTYSIVSAVSGRRIPELEEIVPAIEHEQANGRMPLDSFDVPSVTRKGAFL